MAVARYTGIVWRGRRRKTPPISLLLSSPQEAFYLEGSVYSTYWEDRINMPWDWDTRQAYRYLFGMFSELCAVPTYHQEITQKIITIRSISSTMRYAHMTSQNKSKKSQSDTQASGTTRPVVWVNVYLDETDVPAIEKNYSKPEEVAGWFLALCQTASQVYCKYDAKSDSWCAGMIAPHPDVPTQLMGLSGWSSDPFSAVQSLLFKWFVKLGEFWPEPDKPASKRFR